jgi:hypothetical protein
MAMTPPEQAAVDAERQRTRERIQTEKQRIDAWWAREEFNRMRRLCRLLGVPLPRRRKSLDRLLQAVQERVRAGQMLGDDFFAEYQRKVRSEAAKKRTPAREAQARANLPKMQAALKEKGYPMTAKKKAACCATLAQWRQSQGEEKAGLDAGLKQALPAPSAEVKGAHGKVVEKVREAIQRGLESVRRGARQEGRQVMALLLQAAARTAG